jgi:polar amino acid transport system substrate-binding protein
MGSVGKSWRALRALAVIVPIAVLLPVFCAAADLPGGRAMVAGQALPDRVLVIATKEAPPFAMKGPDGSWQGIGIDLWRNIADQLHLHYRFVEMRTVPDLLKAAADGSADAAVAAITVTASRAQTIDFTQPFYETGLGVAVRGDLANWVPVARAFLSLSFLRAILVLIGIALFVGIVIWLFERRANESFAGHPLRGMTSGIWWSAVAMTQAGAAQNAPASLPGRLLAVVWMIASIVVIAVFTASVTSAITTHQLQSIVQNADDLRSLRVGAVDGSSSVDFLDTQRISHTVFRDPESGLRALEAGTLDAFVYDRPLLTWTVQQKFSRLQVLRVTFDRQNYAIALPQNSALRVPLDIALLADLDSDWWDQVLYHYLGTADVEPGNKSAWRSESR